MQLHASCVALKGRGALILGPSGSGKSSLALALMALGCDLVSDDRTDVTLRDDWPVAMAPSSLEGRIEARGIGILSVEHIKQARLQVVIDLDQVETMRLPPDRRYTLLHRPLPLLHKVESPYFAAAIKHYLLAGKAMC